MRKFKRITKLAKILRSEKGCPWDKSRELVDMGKYLKEETQEVIEALRKGDHENLREEIGDVMFTLVLTAQIAEEEGHFTMKDVLKGIEEKIVSRHTWVFGKDKARTPEEALEKWRENKKKEKTTPKSKK